MRICLVTPDITGPVRNGEIGTHCHRLAILLAERGHKVTVIFTGPFESGDLLSNRAILNKHGIDFYIPEEAPKDVPHPDRVEDWFLKRSHAVYRLLRFYSFDLVHFQDRDANGFISIQAKRTGVAFEDTCLAVTLHGNTEWDRERRRAWPDFPVPDAKLDYMERYSAEHADLVLSPTQYMIDWNEAQGSRVCADRRVLPYLAQSDELPVLFEGQPDLAHLIFYGRLDSRDGLEIFCDAIDALIRKHSAFLPKRITFLGKTGNAGETDGRTYLERRFLAWPKDLRESTTYLTHYTSSEAAAYLRSTRGVAVLPFLSENLSMPLLDVIESGSPFLATETAGNVEAADPRILCAPTAKGLADAIEKRGERLKIPAVHSYSAQKAQANWSDFHREVPVLKPWPAFSYPKVSICIPHFNHGNYLPAMLESLSVCDYPNLEVNVVDDGSTSAKCLQTFRAMRDQYRPRGWHFLEKKNEGIGATRNAAAELATGEYLVFLDSDNAITHDAISRFARALQISKVDCVTSHMWLFTYEEAGQKMRKFHQYYLPIGPCLEIGMAQNVFGDASFCIRREVFFENGGFTLDRSASYEDWEFLAKLCLSGKQLDVVPLALIHYRELTSGFSKVTSRYLNQARVLRPYDAVMPSIFRKGSTKYLTALAHHERLSDAYGKHVVERQYVEKIVEVDKVVYVPVVQYLPHPELQARSYRVYRKAINFVLGRPRLRQLARFAVRFADQCRMALQFNVIPRASRSAP